MMKYINLLFYSFVLWFGYFSVFCCFAAENEILNPSNDSILNTDLENQLNFNEENLKNLLDKEATLIENSFYKFDFPDNQKVLYKKYPDSHLEICRIFLDNVFFAEFKTDYRGTPIIWPICSENGTLMTRSYPMIEEEKIDELPELNDYEIQYKNVIQNALIATAAESKDHPHQRSLWFTHGNVDDCDFWALTDSKIQCSITHIGFFQTEKEGQKTKGVRLIADGFWINGKTNQPICQERRTISFGFLETNSSSKLRFIDYNIQLTALNENVRFGDTKEGSFGVRVPGSMDVEATKRNPNWKGKILNNLGDVNENAWGKRAEWVDYSGTVARRLNSNEIQSFYQNKEKDAFELTTAGITIMNSPLSFRFPSWFHVRTYGLFAVNPFGKKDFESVKKEETDGSFLLEKGKTESFDYRVLFHDNELNAEQLQILFDKFSNDRSISN